jgi:hypothetical protein
MNKELINEYFEYKSGELYWIKKPCSRIVIGTNAGSLNKVNKRFYVRINKKRYLRSRLIFAMHYGYFPKEVDHKDGNTLNDRIENLRACLPSQNQKNRKLQKNNTSGFKNIVFDKRHNKWQIRLVINKIQRSLGLYSDIELAELVAIEARNKYFGEFANHGEFKK